MGVPELSKWLEPEPREKADTVTQEEAKYADKLYQKFVNYWEGLAGIPQDLPTEDELQRLAEIMRRMD